MAHGIDDKTSLPLNRLLGECDRIIYAEGSRGNSRENAAKIDLPTAPNAEYFFRLWFYEDGERQITAQLIQHRSDDTDFWYRPFEMAEFSGSEEDLVTEFCKDLEALLTHDTRVVQRKGWLFWHFSCEYRAEEKWKSVFSHSVFRGGRFKLPHIEGRGRVYHSAAISSEAPKR